MVFGKGDSSEKFSASEVLGKLIARSLAHLKTHAEEENTLNSDWMSRDQTHFTVYMCMLKDTDVVSLISQLFLKDIREIKWRANGNICLNLIAVSDIKKRCQQ